jgi:hypothetical protein
MHRLSADTVKFTETVPRIRIHMGLSQCSESGFT